jgi:hypothetical protein
LPDNILVLTHANRAAAENEWPVGVQFCFAGEGRQQIHSVKRSVRTWLGATRCRDGGGKIHRGDRRGKLIARWKHGWPAQDQWHSDSALAAAAAPGEVASITLMSSISIPFSPPFCIHSSLRLVALKQACFVVVLHVSPSTEMVTVSPWKTSFT